METAKYLYIICPKCAGKLKLMAPDRACKMTFGCPHCKNKLKLVYNGEHDH